MSIKLNRQTQRPKPSGLPIAGKVRLGDKRKTDKGKEYPVNLDYFRLDDAPRVADYYGPQPTELKIRLFYDTIEQNFPTAFERYKGNWGLVCRGDSERIEKRIIPTHDIPVIIDGKAQLDYEDEEGPHRAGDVVPCPGIDVAQHYPRCTDCKATGRLFFGVRDPHSLNPMALIDDAWVAYELETHSLWYNISTIMERLQWLYDIAGTLKNVPLIIRREQVDIPFNFTKDTKERGRSTRSQSLVAIDLDPIAYPVLNQLTMQQFKALGGPVNEPHLYLVGDTPEYVDSTATDTSDHPEKWDFDYFWRYLKECCGFEPGDPEVLRILDVEDTKQMAQRYTMGEAIQRLEASRAL